MSTCKHENFEAQVDVNRLQHKEGDDSKLRFTADVRIRCTECGVPMRFIGLPAGLDLNGASVSADGCEGRFAIAPKGEVVNVIEGAPLGFTIRRSV